MSDIGMDSIVLVKEGQMSCDLAGEAVILSFRSGIYYTLNPVGTCIWNLIQKPIKVKKILEILLEEFDVDEGQCREDLTTLLEKLHEEGLITIENKNS